jgi:hypothetical protein
MRGAILPLPQYAFMAWCSVKKKHRVSFTCLLFMLYKANRNRLLGLRCATLMIKVKLDFHDSVSIKNSHWLYH